VSQEEINAWRLYTNKKFKSHFFPAGHFFIRNKKHLSYLLNLIQAETRSQELCRLI
jgi:surfactin synthase thioesterase subunit